MESIAYESGVFEGQPGRLVFTHNIELLKSAQYKRADEFVVWSIANGGPGIACLSEHTFNRLIGECVTRPQEAVRDVTDAGLRQVVHEVCGQFIVLCNWYLCCW